MRRAQLVAHALEVLAPAPVDQRAKGQALGEVGRGQAGQHLQLGQILQQILLRRDVADPDVGRQRFGKTADVNHPVQLVQAGQRGVGFGVEVEVNVVLDNHEIVFIRQLQNAVQLRQLGGGAGRALQPRLGEEDLGAGGLDALFQHLQVPALWRTRRTNQARTDVAQRRQLVRVARLVDQHRVPRSNQAPNRQVQALAAALHQQHLLGLQRHFMLGQLVAHQVAQRRIALGVPIAAQIHFLGRQVAQAALEAIGKQPVAGDPAAAGFAGHVAALEDAPHVPHRIEAVGAARAGLGQRAGGTRPHKKARMGPRYEEAQRHQTVVGVNHGVDAHFVRSGELAY